MESLIKEACKMEIQNPREFFEKVLPEKFDPEKAEGIDIVLQLNISGDDGGNWYAIIKDKQLDIKEGVHPDPKVAIDIKSKDWVKLINGKMTGERAFLAGKLKVTGEVTDALALKQLGFL
jgi:putative sterol carrier protein